MKLTEKDHNIGFSTISDGWHAFKVAKAEFTKDENDADTKTIRVEGMVIDDGNEGAFLSVFCKLDTKFGRSKLARLAGYTGAADVVEKKYKLPGAELTSDEWGEKFLDIDNPKSSKVILALCMELTDKTFKGMVSSITGKDRDGKERVYQNINQIDSYGKGKASSAKPHTPGTTPDDLIPESEDW